MSSSPSDFRSALWKLLGSWWERVKSLACPSHRVHVLEAWGPGQGGLGGPPGGATGGVGETWPSKVSATPGNCQEAGYGLNTWRRGRKGGGGDILNQNLVLL